MHAQVMYVLTSKWRGKNLKCFLKMVNFLHFKGILTAKTGGKVSKGEIPTYLVPPLEPAITIIYYGIDILSMMGSGQSSNSLGPHPISLSNKRIIFI